MTRESATTRYSATTKNYTPNRTYGPPKKREHAKKDGLFKKDGPPKKAEQTEKVTHEKVVLHVEEVPKFTTDPTDNGLPYDACKEAMIDGFRQYLKTRLSLMSPERRPAAIGKLLEMNELTQTMYKFVLPILRQRLGGYVYKTTPIVEATVHARLRFGVPEWQAFVKKEFDTILASVPTYTVQGFSMDFNETAADEPKFIQSSPVPLADCLRSRFPDTDAFYAALGRARKLVNRDMTAMANLIRRIILRYASHGLYRNNPVRFHPADLIPLESQIRETDFLDVIDVCPLDRKLSILRDFDLRGFFRMPHLHYMYCRVLLLNETDVPSRMQHGSWNKVLRDVNFQPEQRALKHAYHTRLFALGQLEQDIVDKWYKGKLFRRTLGSLCKVLLWCHLAPEEEQRYYELKQPRGLQRNAPPQVRLKKIKIIIDAYKVTVIYRPRDFSGLWSQSQGTMAAAIAAHHPMSDQMQPA